MNYLVHHTPSACSKQMKQALSVLDKASTTLEQKEALAYLERELNLALSYITELEWDTEEAAAFIKQTYGPSSEWVASLEYMEDWAHELHSRLNSHKYRKLSCLVKGDSFSETSEMR